MYAVRKQNFSTLIQDKITAITEQINKLNEIAAAFERLAEIEQGFADAQPNEDEKMVAVTADLPVELQEGALLKELQIQLDQLNEQRLKCVEASTLQVAFWDRLANLVQLEADSPQVNRTGELRAAVTVRPINETNIDDKMRAIDALIARIKARIDKRGLQMELSLEQLRMPKKRLSLMRLCTVQLERGWRMLDSILTRSTNR